jgi:hypothetical protein
MDFIGTAEIQQLSSSPHQPFHSHGLAAVNIKTIPVAARDPAVASFCDFCMTFWSVFRLQENHGLHRYTRIHTINLSCALAKFQHLWAAVKCHSLTTAGRDPPAAVLVFCDFCMAFRLAFHP